MISAQTKWNKRVALLEDVRKERHTEEERNTFLFIVLFFFFSFTQNTIRSGYNEAFHMKLFLSGSAGVQLGLLRWGAEGVCVCV